MNLEGIVGIYTLSTSVRTLATVDARNTSFCMKETQNCSVGRIVQFLSNGRHFVMFKTMTTTKREAVIVIEQLRTHRRYLLRWLYKLKYWQSNDSLSDHKQM